VAKPKHLGVDGYQRPREEDEKLSQNVLALFSTPVGMSVMQYLKSITVDAVAGPNISDAELRHLEGQRYLVALISKRINHAQRIKK
jgi:hypothetical protein